MNYKKFKQAGFTLIELLVSIAIFVFITSIIVINQSRFGVNLLVTNLAYDVALGIRQAQVYGVSVRQVQGVAANQQFNSSYGIHFANSGYFILFADVNNDGSYDTATNNGSAGCINPPPAGHSPECITVFKVAQGNSITNFCGKSGGSIQCASGAGIDSLEILFRRPNPEPSILGYKGGGKVGNYSSATITVTSSQGVSKTINVLPSGQISIQ